MPETSYDLPFPELRARGNILSPLVALLAHPDEEAVAHFREVFDDVACDWRLVRVSDGTAATRHVMNKGLPDLMIVSADLPQVGGPELVEWLRSFRNGQTISVLIYGEPADEDARARFRHNDAKLMLPVPCPRVMLAASLEEFVSRVEKRRFALPV